MEIKDFVLEQPGFLAPEMCVRTVEYIENMGAAGMMLDRSSYAKRHVQDDKSFGLYGEYAVRVEGTADIANTFLELFWSLSYQIYRDKYSVLHDVAPHSILFIKGQKTEVGQGFHQWHQECAEQATAGRILSFVVYLNDVAEGGETEFLYYPRRVKPEQGKLLLFPGAFTHTHRGNPPLSGAKYILTGWVEY